MPPPELQVVVGEADRGAAERDEEHGEPFPCVLRECEKRDHGRADDQEPAHRRGSLLDDVRGRPFGADLLSEVARTEQLDELRPDDDGGDHRHQARDQDWDHARAKFVISSAMPSRPTARDALTRTASPGRRNVRAASIAPSTPGAQTAGRYARAGSP